LNILPNLNQPLLPELLDRLVVLGQLAEQLSHALGGNGHRPEKAAKLIQQLANDRGVIYD